MIATKNIDLDTYEATDETSWLTTYNENINKIDEFAGQVKTNQTENESSIQQINSQIELINSDIETITQTNTMQSVNIGNLQNTVQDHSNQILANTTKNNLQDQEIAKMSWIENSSIKLTSNMPTIISNLSLIKSYKKIDDIFTTYLIKMSFNFTSYSQAEKYMWNGYNTAIPETSVFKITDNTISINDLVCNTSFFASELNSPGSSSIVCLSSATCSNGNINFNFIPITNSNFSTRPIIAIYELKLMKGAYNAN